MGAALVGVGEGIAVDATVLVALRVGMLVAVEIETAVCVGATIWVEVEVGITGADVTVWVAVGLGGIEVGGRESGHPGMFEGKLAGSPPGGRT